MMPKQPEHIFCTHTIMYYHLWEFYVAWEPPNVRSKIDLFDKHVHWFKRNCFENDDYYSKLLYNSINLLYIYKEGDNVRGNQHQKGNRLTYLKNHVF